MITIMHDHPCPPKKIPVPADPLPSTFTYDCDCGKIMMVESYSGGNVAWGKEYLLMGHKPSFLEIG